MRTANPRTRQVQDALLLTVQRGKRHDEDDDSSSRGYTLVELLVSMGIMIVVTGAIFRLINPSQATAQIQPEVQDMQQRMRVATDAMFRDVVMAGAGPYQGTVTGSLNNFFAPIIPRRIEFLNPIPI